jgi:hypothetical protein
VRHARQGEKVRALPCHHLGGACLPGQTQLVYQHHGGGRMVIAQDGPPLALHARR